MEGHMEGYIECGVAGQPRFTGKCLTRGCVFEHFHSGMPY